MNGGTNIALSIKQAGQLLKEEDPQAARIIVLLTDGRVDAFQGKPLMPRPPVLYYQRCHSGRRNIVVV